jgi:AsmA protein
LRKTTKLLLSGISILLFVVTILVYVLPRLISQNTYKTNIAALIKEKIGRDVVFKGDIAVSVFPRLSLSAEKVAISNAPGFQELPFISVDKSAFTFKPLPLLANKIEISSIDLDGLALNLTKDKQGVSNWDDLLAAHSTTQTDKTNAKQDGDKFNSQSGLTALAVGGISIQNAHVNWDNQQTSETLKLNNIHFDADKFVFGEQVKINFAMDISGSLVKFPIAIKCVSGMLVDEKLDFVFSDSQLDGVASGVSINGQPLVATMTIPNAQLSIERQALQLSGLQFQSGDIKLTAEMTGEELIDKPSIQGFAKIEPFNLINAIKQWDIAFPSMSDAKAMTYLGMAFHFQADSGQAEFDNWDVVLDNSHGKGFFEVKDYSRPKISFGLDVDSIDVDRYFGLQDKATKQSPGMALAASTFTAPLDWLRKLDAEGNLSLGKLIFNQMVMQNLHLRFSSKNGIAKIKQ